MRPGIAFAHALLFASAFALRTLSDARTLIRDELRLAWTAADYLSVVGIEVSAIPVARNPNTAKFPEPAEKIAVPRFPAVPATTSRNTKAV